MRYVGNAAFSDQALAKQTGLRYGTQLRKDDLKKAASSIEAFYRHRGYSNARVAVQSFKGGPPRVDDFVFVINEGSRKTALRRPATAADVAPNDR